VVAEEGAAPPTGESAPTPQAEPEAPITEATLPVASSVEGETLLKSKNLRE
jgi:hypothetical protein